MERTTSQIPLEPIDDVISTPRSRSRFCFCLWAPYSSSDASESWQRIDAGGGGGGNCRWWSPVLGALMKVRGLSELVAGPRWKTFIRRFNRCRNAGGGGWRMGSATFQYDPLSYALNFDEGRGGSLEGHQTGEQDFSSRFVGQRSLAYSLNDLGGYNPPPHPSPPPPRQSRSF